MAEARHVLQGHRRAGDPALRVVERAAAGQELALGAPDGKAHDLLVTLRHVGAAAGQHVAAGVLDGGAWCRVHVTEARGLLVPGEAKDSARGFVGGQDAARAVEDDDRIGKALDGGVRGLPGLDDRAQASSARTRPDARPSALKSAAGDAISSVPRRGRAAKSFS